MKFQGSDNYVATPERTAKNIALYHRPGSVQTNLIIGELGLKPTDPDWLFTYDACSVPLLAPEDAPKELA